MTKKHYIEFVRILSAYPSIKINKDFVNDLMLFFKRDNSNFNADKFISALNK